MMFMMVQKSNQFRQFIIKDVQSGLKWKDYVSKYDISYAVTSKVVQQIMALRQHPV